MSERACRRSGVADRDPVVLVVSLEEGPGPGAADEIARGVTDAGGEVRLWSATGPTPRDGLAQDVLAADGLVLVAERWSEVSSFEAGRLVSSVERAATRHDLENTVVSWFGGPGTPADRARHLTTFAAGVAARWGAVLVPPGAGADGGPAGGGVARHPAYTLGTRVSQVAWATSELRSC